MGCFRRVSWGLLGLVIMAAIGCGVEPAGPTSASTQEQTLSWQAAKLGQTRPVFQNGNLYLAGQPGESDIAAIKQAGILRVISVCGEGEIDWDEKAKVEAAGLEFVSLPLPSPDAMTDPLLDQASQLLAESSEKPTLLHCKGAVRAAAVWVAFQGQQTEVGPDAAVEQANAILTIPAQWTAPAQDFARRKASDAAQAQQPAG